MVYISNLMSKPSYATKARPFPPKAENVGQGGWLSYRNILASLSFNYLSVGFLMLESRCILSMLLLLMDT